MRYNCVYQSTIDDRFHDGEDKAGGDGDAAASQHEHAAAVANAGHPRSLSDALRSTIRASELQAGSDATRRGTQGESHESKFD